MAVVRFLFKAMPLRKLLSTLFQKEKVNFIIAVMEK
jgi:hypothetical protein